MAITAHALPNGMRLLLEENRSAKVISFNALVNVGSADETDSEAGICHVIEHMLFKGTPTRPTGSIARDVEAAGGDINAYTSMDQTVFYINMASQFTSKGLEILSDALMNPLFDKGELEREKEVILEEIRREQDNPSRMCHEYLFQASFKAHTYGRPIIGFPKTVKSFSSETLKSFHRKWYTPRNIVFIVVGDFTTEKMAEELSRIFAEFKGGERPATDIKKEPQQCSASLVIKTMNVQSSYLSMGWHIPEIINDDVPALDILAHILGGSDSSRLEQRIKEQKRLAHNVYAYAFTPKHPGLFVVGAMMNDRDSARTAAAICEELSRVLTEPVCADELTLAKLNIRSNEIYDKETVGGQAAKLASFEASAGSYEYEQRYYSQISEVNSEKLMEVAKRYLTPENLTAVIIVSDGSKWLKDHGELKAVMTVPARNVAARDKTKGKPAPVQRTLKNGARLVLYEDHALPIVSVCATFLGGTRMETKRTCGISGLMARTLVKGTGSRSAVQIAKNIERLAGELDGFSGKNSAGLRAEFLSESTRDGMELFADVLLRPAFTDTEVAREKHILIKAIDDHEDNLSSRAFSEFLKTLFPTHPYGLKGLGDKTSVARMTGRDLKAFHSRVFCGRNMVIAIAGDVNSTEMENMANELLGGMPKGLPPLAKLKKDAPPRSPRESLITKKKKQQAHIVIGFMGLDFKSRDRYAMAVLNNILAGQGGRLFLNLRDRQGLAYAVSSVAAEGIEPGYIAVYIGTEPSKIELATKGILREFEAIRREPVTKDELSRAKQYIAGSYELDRQRMGNIASIYAFNMLYGLGMSEADEYPKKIMEVAREDVLRVAEKYIKPEAWTMAIIKPS